MAISINHGTRVIFVPREDMVLIQSVPTEIRQLDLNSFRLALKDLEDSEEGMAHPTTHNHVAPISVGGVTLARVVELINEHTVTFEDGQYAVNLTGANSNVADKVNVNQVSVRSANSAGLIQQDQLDSLKYQVESIFTSHQGFGQSFYVATNGSDNNSGTSSSSPKCTIAAAYALCVAGRGDVIFLLTPDVSVGVFAENVVMDKEDTHIRGAGRGVMIQPASGVGVSILADNCELAGLRVASSVGSTHDNIQIYGKFPKLRGLYVVGADTGGATPVGSGHGVHFLAGEYGVFEDVVVEKCAGSGVKFTDIGHANGAPREVTFRRSKIYYNRRYGIEFTGASANSTRLNWIDTDNAITHNSLGGVYAGPNTQRNVIRSTNYIKDNASYPSGAGGDQYEIIDEGATDFMVEPMPLTMSQAVWGHALEGLTAEEMLRVMLAALAGKRAGLGTATEQYMAQDGVTPRITLTPDASGNGTPVINGG